MNITWSIVSMDELYTVDQVVFWTLTNILFTHRGLALFVVFMAKRWTLWW
jgi:hypothetical protein